MSTPVFLVVLAIFVGSPTGLFLAWLVARKRARRAAEVPRIVQAVPEIAPDDPDRPFCAQLIAAGFRWLGDRLPKDVRSMESSLFSQERLAARIPEDGRDRLLRLPGTTCSQRCEHLACDHRVFDLYVMDRYLDEDRSSIRVGPCLFARVCGHCGRRQKVASDQVGPSSPRVGAEATLLREVGVTHYLASLAAARQRSLERAQPAVRRA